MRTHPFALRLGSLSIVLACLFASGHLGAQEPSKIPARPPIVLLGQHVNVLVATPRGLAQASDSLSVARALETCPPAIRGAFATAYANAPTGVQGASRDDRVVFVLAPTSNASTGCDAGAIWSPALLTRAVDIAMPSAYQVRSVEVSARGHAVTVDSTVSRAVINISGYSQSTERPTELAAWVSARDLAPDAAGNLPEVTVKLSSSGSTSPDTVRLGEGALRDLWHDLVIARIERLGDRPVAHAPMHLPAPTDSALRSAHALYSAGNVVGAARIAEQRLATEQLSRRDVRAARMMIVGTLLAYDDSSAARIVLADVLDDAPCLTLSDAQSAAERLIDPLRPPARCSVTPLRRVLRASLIPGMGHQVIGDPAVAFAAAAATGTAVIVASSLANNGNRAYRRYLDAGSTGEATQAYDDAVRNRRAARIALGGAFAAWFLSGTTAVLMERAHARSVARVHDYDLQPTVGLLPDGRGGEARVSMSVTW